jgi:hypothetical protein
LQYCARPIFASEQLALLKHGEDRATPVGVGVEDAVQVVGLKDISQLLSASGIVEADKAIVGKTKTDPGCDELACQPGMTVAIKLAV